MRMVSDIVISIKSLNKKEHTEKRKRLIEKRMLNLDQKVDDPLAI